MPVKRMGAKAEANPAVWMVRQTGLSQRWQKNEVFHWPIWQEQLHRIMAFYHDVRELMQEDNRPTCVGVIRFKIEINYTRRECNAFSRPKLDFEISRRYSPTYARTQPYCVLLGVRAPDCLYIRRSFSM